VLETLNDDSQILLLYLADELPESDRLQTERRLASEPALAEELEQLRSIYGQIGARLQEADELSVPVNVSAMAQSIGRQMRQRLAEPRPVVPAQNRPATGRVRPWLIPSAVAAAILVGSAVWILRSGTFESHQQVAVRGPTTTTTHPANGMPTGPAGDEKNLALFQDSFTPPSRDIADVLNSSASQKDLSMQDDVSPYLLKVGTIQE
jgi:hypothetical protein